MVLVYQISSPLSCGIHRIVSSMKRDAVHVEHFSNKIAQSVELT